MSDMEIISQISSTLQSADQIWPSSSSPSSPFYLYSSWIGFVATADQANLIDTTIKNTKNNAKTSFSPGDDGFEAVRDLIYNLLPADGKALFNTGYNQATIYVNPSNLAWTPSNLIINLVLDPKDNSLFTLLTGACGRGSV